MMISCASNSREASALQNGKKLANCSAMHQSVASKLVFFFLQGFRGDLFRV
jgi:hypothetical protein